MSLKELIVTAQMAGATLSDSQVLILCAEAQEKFGIDKGLFMLMLLGGSEDFKNWIYERASKMLQKDLRSEYFQTAKNSFGEPLIKKLLDEGF